MKEDRESLADRTGEMFEKISEDDISSKEEMIKNRQRAAAKMLLNGDYPSDVKEKMQTSFSEGNYELTKRLASEHDIKGRENLDAKITMYPNPNFQAEVDIDKLNQEIQEEFLKSISKPTLDRLLEQGEEVALKQSELEAAQPQEAEDTNPRFLFKAEGIDQEFDSAFKAIRAYKEKNGIAQPKPGKHSFRKTLVYTNEEECCNEKACCGNSDQESMESDQTDPR